MNKHKHLTDIEIANSVKISKIKKIARKNPAKFVQTLHSVQTPKLGVSTSYGEK